MADKILFQNKEKLIDNTSIPDKNKVTANDMNEIKEVVNSHADDIEELETNKADRTEIPTDLSELSNETTKFVNETQLDDVNDNLQEQITTLKTDSGHTIELSMNSSNYVLTATLKNKDGETLNTTSIDLPIESAIVDGYYDNVNKKIVLVLQNGNTIDVPVGDLISGLQAEITEQNKLSSDLVDDTNKTNKFVTTTEKTSWNAKYNKPNSGIPKSDLSSEVQTSLGKADTALQEHQDISGKEDKSNKVTSLSSSSTDTQYPSAKCVYDSQVEQDNEISVLRNLAETELEDTTATGTSITVNDSANAPAKLGIGGNTLQSNLPAGYTQLDYIQSSGTQYIDTNYNITTSEQFSVIVDVQYNATSTANQILVSSGVNSWIGQSNGYYGCGASYRSSVVSTDRATIEATLSNKVIMKIGNETITREGVSTEEGNIRLFGVSTYFSNAKIFNCKLFNSSNVLVRNFIPCKNANNEVGLYDLVSNQFFANAGTGNFVAGDVTLPSPTNEIPIHNVSGHNEFLVQNKNLGIENFNKKLTIVGTGQNRNVQTANHNIGEIIKVKANTHYIASGDFSRLSGEVIRIGMFDEYPIENSITTNFVYGASGLDFTTNVNTEYILICNASDLKDTITPKLFICETALATSYVPHKEQTAEFTLVEGQKMFLEDYLADNGIHHIYTEVTLDGSNDESFTVSSSLSTTDYTAFLYNKSNIIQASDTTSINLYCNKLLRDSSNHRTSNKLNCWVNHFNSGQIGFRLPNTITTVEELRTYLSTNNLTFVYKLKEETIEPYTELQQQQYNRLKKMLSYYQQTNVNTISAGDLEAILTLGHKKSNRLRIDALENAIISLGGNI